MTALAVDFKTVQPQDLLEVGHVQTSFNALHFAMWIYYTGGVDRRKECEILAVRVLELPGQTAYSSPVYSHRAGFFISTNLSVLLGRMAIEAI